MFCKVIVLLLALGCSLADQNAGCLLDGTVYAKGDKIIIQPCLAELTCLGNNDYSEITSLGGQCPKQTRDVDGQTGCLFDGTVYATGDKIIIQPCLAELTCQGNNAYTEVTALGGVCPKQTRDVDGQTGCLYDGTMYAKGDKIIIQPCLAELTCEGNNNYSEITELGGQC
ncbi:hypothetical protein V1264_022822 [Littorina saxatilis]|uniref:Uncharacterized protein n=1 Tax=Littorina saxatilis TaxID=31220 RepID=A0AAN9G926_9CAEN